MWADGCELLLRGWINAYFCHVNNHAYRVHAAEVVVRRGSEQFDSKHLLMRWWHRWGAHHCFDWEWLAVYHFGALGVVGRISHLGNEAIRAAVARENGPRTRLMMSILCPVLR